MSLHIEPMGNDMLATFYRNVPNSKVELALFYLPKPSDQANVHGRARRLANSVTPRSSAIFMAGCPHRGLPEGQGTRPTPESIDD